MSNINYKFVHASVARMLTDVDVEMQQNPTPVLFQLYKQLTALENLLRTAQQDGT